MNITKKILKIEANVQKKLKIKELAQKYPTSVEEALSEAQRTLDAAAKESKEAKLWGEVVDKLKDIQNENRTNLYRMFSTRCLLYRK